MTKIGTFKEAKWSEELAKMLLETVYAYPQLRWEDNESMRLRCLADADRLLPFVQAKVNEAVAVERERCASIAESRRSEVTFGTSEYLMAGEIASAIRSVKLT